LPRAKPKPRMMTLRRNRSENMHAHLLWIFEMITKAYEHRFYGSITINFCDGGVTNVEKKESFKPPAVLKVAVLHK
jgi:hypothetical protein